MTRDGYKPDTAEAGKVPDDNTFMIFGTLVDTTWRMFVPSVGFTLLGVWLDGTLNTKPWLMSTGIIIGIFGAYLLVAKQLKNTKRNTKS